MKTEPIPQELTSNDFFLKTIYNKYLISSVLAMLATSVAGMIDTVLVGRFLGETALSAMSLVSPVYLFYYTIGAVVGIGGTVVGNLHIGQSDIPGYRKAFTMSFVVTVVLCTVTTVGGLLYLEPLVLLLGGKGQTFTYMVEYLRWYIIGGSFTLLIYLPLNFLKIQGKPEVSSALFLLSSGLNVALTWLFLSPVCAMGIKGASIATGLSMGVTALVGLYILFTKTKDTRFIKGWWSFRRLRDILACGSPNGCNNLFNALKILVINALILYIGASSGLSTFVLIKSVSDLLTGILMGVSTALMPIVGVFFGEKDWNSIRRVCIKALKIGGVLTLVLAAVVSAFPVPLCALFNITDPNTLANSRPALLCLSGSFLFAFFNLMMSGYFSSVKRPLLANLILGMRLLAFLAPFAIGLGLWLGINGIWLALIAADAATLLASVAIIAGLRRKAPKLDWYLLDTTHEGEGEISFSVKNTLDDVLFASQKITDFCDENTIGPKKTMRVSLALEEMLTVIVSACMDTQKEQYIDIRIKKLGEDVLLRIRNGGKIFDPLHYYEENQDDEAMADRLLGIKMIVKSAQEITFQQTFGTNNLMIRF